MASNGIGDLGQYDFMNKGMYPGSQIDRSYYATPTQVPLGAQAAIADYDPHTNPLTGQPVSRFADGGIASFKTGGSPFEDDPNNFAADLTKAYQKTLGRDPSTEELRANVNALNRDPDAYAFIVDQLAEDPSAAKFHAENVKPQVDEEGNTIPALGYDPEQTSMELKSGYGKWKPQAKQGGIGGFYNNNPLVALPLTAAMIMAPEIIPALMETGAGAAAAMGPTYAELGYIPLAETAGTTGASTIAQMGPTYAELGYTPGLENIVQMGPTYAELGYTPGAENIAQMGPTYGELGYTPQAGPTYAELGYTPGAVEKGITAKQAYGAKTLMDMAMKSASMGQDSQAGPSATTTPLIFNPNVNRASTPGIAPMGSNQPYGQLYDTKTNTYNYFPQRYAQGGITNLARGGNASLGSYSDGGHLLKGPGDGMSDHIPATIGGKQPARLADGEFVIPADVVSHLGNGSTDAGAKQLYKMMDKIRKARTGRKSQGKQINPNKYLLKG